jgi:hypothetical protein
LEPVELPATPLIIRQTQMKRKRAIYFWIIGQAPPFLYLLKIIRVLTLRHSLSYHCHVIWFEVLLLWFVWPMICCCFANFFGRKCASWIGSELGVTLTPRRCGKYILALTERINIERQK